MWNYVWATPRFLPLNNRLDFKGSRHLSPHHLPEASLEWNSEQMLKINEYDRLEPKK